jgi:hypothetical protein
VSRARGGEPRSFAAEKTCAGVNMADSAAAAPAPTESVLVKVQKYVDTLKAKNAKLLDENAKLRATVQELRSSHSRIRRIPKTAGAAAGAAQA